MSILFASPRLLREFSDLDGRLYTIFFELAERFWPAPGQPCRVVCIHRTPEEERAAGGQTGIHTQGPPHRAIDVGGANLTQAQIDLACRAINLRWEYDSERPTKQVAFGVPHGTGPHIHLQVHPATCRREP